MTTCYDCPYHGGKRAMCCAEEARRYMEAREYLSDAEDAIQSAEIQRKRLADEGQPGGNRKQRRAAMKGRRP